MLRPFKELDQIRGHYLFNRAATDAKDWRFLFELGMTDLHSYRLDQGLKNIVLSRMLARENGQEKSFAMTLRGRDESGLIAMRLMES